MVEISRVLQSVFALPTQIITGNNGFLAIRLTVDGGELTGCFAKRGDLLITIPRLR